MRTSTHMKVITIYVNKIATSFIRKLMNLPMFIIAISLIMLNFLLKQNDSEYVPKSQTRTVHKWMRKLSKITMKKMGEVTSELERIMLKYLGTKRNRKRKRSKKGRQRCRLLVTSATAMNAQNKSRSNMITFDTDSVAVGIDNRCSACISHVPEDFVGDRQQ